MTIRLNTLEKYAKEVFARPAIQTYLLNNTVQFDYQTVKDWYPRLHQSDSCGVETAGQIWLSPKGDTPDLEMSSWILVDANQAKRVVRHEIAHIVQFVCDLQGSWHGRGFGEALRIVSPMLHKYGKRSDRGWHTTPEIEKARRKFHRLTTLDEFGTLSSDDKNVEGGEPD